MFANLLFGIAYIAGIKRVRELGTQGGGRGGGVLRIFLGLKFSVLGFFLVVKFGKYFFGWPDLSRDFFGCIEHDSARISQLLSFVI